MKKESKTIRINKSILTNLLNKAEVENRSFSNVIETICNDYFSITSRNEFCVNGIKYMPIHMLNEDIYDIFRWAQSMVSKNGDCCEVKVRRHHGSKGVAFSMNYFNIDKNKVKSLVRRYSFSVNPNWEILDFFDHWTYSITDDNTYKSYASENINVKEKSKDVIKEIQKKMVKRETPEMNPIFNTQDWIEIYYNHEKYILEEY